MLQKEKGSVLTLFLVTAGMVILLSFIFFLFTRQTNKSNTTKEQSTETEAIQTPITDVPKEVNKFINNIDVETFEAQGMTIYKGSNPPSIEGRYQLNSLVVAYDSPNWTDSLQPGDSILSYTVRLYDQKPDGSMGVDFQALGMEDKSVGTGAFISGNDNCFSIFIDSKGITDECNYRWPEIISACTTENGLTKFQDGFMMKEKEGKGCDEIMPINHLRVISESDGFVELMD